MSIPNTTVQDAPGNSPSHGPLGPQGNNTGKKSGWIWLLVLIALAGGAYYFYKSRPSAESKAAPAPGARPVGGLVSVAVTPALKQNVPYYLSGLGTVTAFNTVTVKSRVDGELQPRGVGVHQALPHRSGRLHFARQQAAILRRVGERLEEICGAGTERTVSEALQGADSQVGIAKGAPHSNFR